MSTQTTNAEVIAEQHEQTTTKTLGFWIYLMTDCILFASLFATYIVLRGNTYGGPSGQDLFDMPFVLLETLILLTSSFTCGLAVMAAKSNRKQHALVALVITFLLGGAFLTLELSEFMKFASEGYSWQISAFLSAFFTLVGTHGLHIAVGLMWVTVIAWQIMRQGFTSGVVRRLGLFSLFWHFLDIIWIFIFTIVYLMGAM
jgi:cytochrome o ubiquinol oxidase subunit III